VKAAWFSLFIVVLRQILLWHTGWLELVLFLPRLPSTAAANHCNKSFILFFDILLFGFLKILPFLKFETGSTVEPRPSEIIAICPDTPPQSTQYLV
jgi:hypothetical protein